MKFQSLHDGNISWKRVDGVGIYSRTSVYHTFFEYSLITFKKFTFRILVCVLDFDWFRNKIAVSRELRYADIVRSDCNERG